jgi:hypothetical protein
MYMAVFDTVLGSVASSPVFPATGSVGVTGAGFGFGVVGFGVFLGAEGRVAGSSPIACAVRMGSWSAA